ncbi:hypothetical protein A9Q99_12750 [Gammaproteobacteria bacterium 45_16_T64]|nr:hypothetical protein A9Q99_12750 [Gammaproteobacteria bacterium 45_16_T64]
MGFVERYAAGVVRWRWMIILGTVVSLAFLASGMKNLYFTSDYRIFFGDENPQYLSYESLKDEYQHSDNVVLVLAPRSGSIFDKGTLRLLEQLTDKSWQLPYAIRVDSLANYQHTEAQGDELSVAPLVDVDTALDDHGVARIKNIVLHEPSLLNNMVSESGHVTGINITVQLPGENRSEGEYLMTAVRSLVADIRNEHSELDVYVTGLIPFNNAFSEAMRKDLTTLMPAMYLLMIVCLWWLLRSIPAVIGTLCVILFSVIAALGTLGHLHIPISPPSVSAPTIILTIAIADCVHILVAYIGFLRQGYSRNKAIEESLIVNFYPIVITSVTTAVGFLSMNLSEVPPYRDMGNLIAFGVIAAMLSSMLFLPAFISLLPAKVKQRQSRQSVRMEQFSDWIIKHNRVLLVSMTAVVIGLVLMIPLNELDNKFVENFSEDIEFRLDSQFTSENLTGVYTIEYSIDSGVEGGVNGPQYLRLLDDFSNWLNAQPEVMHVTSVVDVYKRLNKNLHGDDSEWFRIPESRALASQYLLLYELSLPFGLDLTNQVNLDKSAARVVVVFEDLSSTQMLNIEQRVNTWWSQRTEVATLLASQPVGSSTTLMFSHMGERNSKSLLFGSFLALVVISFILIFALRSLKIGLLSLIPNLLPAAMAFGIWGLMVGKVGMGLSVVTGMTLGIIVDDTVHFLSKYLRGRRVQQLSPEESIRYAFSTVGVALWYTSLILVLGFLLLVFSTYYRNAEMGLMSAITIGIALLVDFVLLPCLLLLVDGEKTDKKRGALPVASQNLPINTA